MKLTILAARRQEAHERLVTAADALADAFELPQPNLTPQERDPTVARLKRDEALGLFLADVVEEAAGRYTATLKQAEGYLSESDILAIPGLTKTSKEAIEAYFAALQPQPIEETAPDDAPAD